MYVLDVLIVLHYKDKKNVPTNDIYDKNSKKKKVTFKHQVALKMHVRKVLHFLLLLIYFSSTLIEWL